VSAEEGVRVEELKRELRRRLPEYMTPAELVVMEEMPLTVNGKIDRKRLLEEWREESRGEEGAEGARTPVEEMVAGIFQEVLKVEGVGRVEDFFELGGHSLLATQVAARVRSVFGVEIGVRALFEEPTIEGFARKIEESRRAGEAKVADVPELVRIPRTEGEEVRFPLSFAQQRLWFIEQLEPGQAIYNIPGAVRLEGPLALEVLNRVINELIRRHEALRT